MKINKKETVTERPPWHSAKNTFDKNEGGAARTKRKTANHIEQLAKKLHGSDPYCASHEHGPTMAAETE